MPEKKVESSKSPQLWSEYLLVENQCLSLLKKGTPSKDVGSWECAANGGECQLTCRAVAVPMRKAMPKEAMVVECIVLMDDLGLDRSL